METSKFHIEYTVISQQFNEYWSDHKSQWGMWNSSYNYTMYILIMSWDIAISDTELEQLFLELCIGITVWVQPGQTAQDLCPVQVPSPP